MQAVKCDKQATFGVEIETADHNEREIAAALNAAGIPTLCNGYNHTDSHSNWKVVPDGSCGAEIVSPILKGEEGLQQVREVCAVLNQIGCRVNRSTGVHVHHGFVNGTFAQMRSILFLYAKLQPYINAMLPSRIASSRDAFYTKQLNLDTVKAESDYISQRLYGSLSRIDEVTAAANYFGTTAHGRSERRYWTVNASAFMDHKTIEFRHHSGSTNAEKIIAWIVFTQNIMTVGMSKNVSSTPLKASGKSKIRHAFWMLGTAKDCPIIQASRAVMVKRIAANKVNHRWGGTQFVRNIELGSRS